MTDKQATLHIEGHEPIELPIYSPSLGLDVIDINKLGSRQLFTYDPGFVSTASCESKITFIDGANGTLLYRGYPIEQLAEKKDYLDVCYLLMNGELPNPEQRKTFGDKLNNHSMVHEQMCEFFNGFRRDAHPMAIMVGVVGALSAFYHESLDFSNEADREKSSAAPYC